MTYTIKLSGTPAKTFATLLDIHSGRETGSTLWLQRTYTSGYCVGNNHTSIRVPSFRALSQRQVTNVYHDLLTRGFISPTGSHDAVGFWLADDGTLYIDKTICITDRTSAKTLAMVNKELAVYHLDSGECINTSDL